MEIDVHTEIKDVAQIIFSVKNELNKMSDMLRELDDKIKLKFKNDSFITTDLLDIDDVGKQIFSPSLAAAAEAAANTIAKNNTNTSKSQSQTHTHTHSPHLVQFSKEVLHKITPKQWFSIFKTPVTDQEQLIIKIVKLVRFDTSTQKTNGNLRLEGALKQKFVYIYLKEHIQTIWKEVPLKDAYEMIRDNCVDILDWVVKKYIDVPELYEKAILALRQMREDACIDTTNGEVTRFFEAFV